MRKPAEPIYPRRTMVGLALAVTLPLVPLQLYKIYVGPLSFDVQLGVGLIVSALASLTFYFAYRTSAQNQSCRTSRVNISEFECR